MNLLKVKTSDDNNVTVQLSKSIVVMKNGVVKKTPCVVLLIEGLDDMETTVVFDIEQIEEMIGKLHFLKNKVVGCRAKKGRSHVDRRKSEY